MNNVSLESNYRIYRNDLIDAPSEVLRDYASQWENAGFLMRLTYKF